MPKHASTLIDWRQVGIELRQHGYGPKRVSVALGKTHGTVMRWMNHGSEPGFSDGHRLLALWAGVTQRDRMPFGMTQPRHKGNRLTAINCGHDPRPSDCMA